MHGNLINKKQSSVTIKMSDKHIQSSHSSIIFFCLEKKDSTKRKKNWHYAQAGKASNIIYDNTQKHRKDPQKINVWASLEKHQYEHISIKNCWQSNHPEMGNKRRFQYQIVEEKCWQTDASKNWDHPKVAELVMWSEYQERIKPL